MNEKRNNALKTRYDKRSVIRAVWKYCIRAHWITIIALMPVLAWWKELSR